MAKRMVLFVYMRSSGFHFTDVSDAESINSFKSKERFTDESETTKFQSLHALGHTMSYITKVPELCDVKFLVGDNEIPIYGVKAVLGTRSRYTTAFRRISGLELD
ncbi:hypothetical protein CHS0354_030949 [Potamilus streckersoni]|uniref:Uncharacterized protein n=1 Tax=Potamilus streckersoni TaxID=2493646 RepID=A0AAE0RYI5_9BIVA|nr:hypothetical protein CHS0354_030949 [Potamilus streckersoni]